MTDTVEEARGAVEAHVHQLAPTKTLSTEDAIGLMTRLDALIAAVRGEDHP